ncbi:MAG: NAD-dependent epimerase/dehydratase family protein [Xanthomonadales bacterium]|nr:NAD-dependent epimerase/dehydratase family protein [Xanthomonadales bacterium]
MRALVLGGTGFIGPPMVEYLLARGHKVTLFNRGQTQTDLFPDVEKLTGDRNDDLDSLKDGSWDVVFDNHATLPRWVQQTAELLKDSARRYVHVSTISVYADPGYTLPDDPAAAEGQRMDEQSPLAQLPEDWDGSEQVTGATYGPFKWMAEAEAEKAFPGRATIVRPGLIVGPGDPTDRFTYWPVRVQRGGEVLAPGSGNDSTQIIDARDLVRFIVTLAENDVSGVFNATGPESRLSMAEMLHGCRAATSGAIDFTWIPADFLEGQGVAPWGDMPCWIPGAPLMHVRIDRALEAGLSFRPLADTVRDTLEWHGSRPEERRGQLRSGLSAEREAEVLAAWHASGA